jgi:hypothetical protein
MHICLCKARTWAPGGGHVPIGIAIIVAAICSRTKDKRQRNTTGAGEMLKLLLLQVARRCLLLVLGMLPVPVLYAWRCFGLLW